MSEVEIPEKLTCKQCGHTWMPRSKFVYRCPERKCMSFSWDEEPEKVTK